MSLIAKATNIAISPGGTTYVYGSGGSQPYVYSVIPGQAGGSVNSATGLYTAPASVVSNYQVVKVVDALSSSATVSVLIGSPLILFCDILQKEMDLANGRVYLWDQKIMQPKDSSLYIAVAVISCKPFGNTNRLNSDGEAEQSVNMQATLQVDIISRGPAARDRKEEIILALNSNYAQSQQEKNSFQIGYVPGSRFVNLSQEDGAAIPYRYSIAVFLQYMVRKTKVVPYFDSFSDPVVVTDL
jgi:hypothetical protein